MPQMSGETEPFRQFKEYRNMSKRLVLGLLLALTACGCFGCATDAGVGVHVGQSKFIERGPGPAPTGFPRDMEQSMTVGVASVQF